MAKRYIDAERLKDSMFAYYECLEESANGRPYGDTLMDYEVVDMIEDCIDNAPTADVVEVVRCSECVNGKKAVINDKGFKICPASGMEITDNDYCSYGERKIRRGKSM